MSGVDGSPSGLEWLANPDTVLGKLQRGTGAGFLEAIALPSGEAAELIWDCVVYDPRWDQQVESRDRYYADLITRRVTSTRTASAPRTAPNRRQIAISAWSSASSPSWRPTV